MRAGERLTRPSAGDSAGALARRAKAHPAQASPSRSFERSDHHNHTACAARRPYRAGPCFAAYAFPNAMPSQYRFHCPAPQASPKPNPTLASPPSPTNISLDIVALADRPWKILLRLALPTMGAMLLQSVVNFIDTLFFRELGPQAGTVAHSALLPSHIVLWAFGGTLSAIGVGTQAYTARRIAEGKTADAGAVMTNALAFCTVGGVLATAAAVMFLPAALHYQKLTGEVYDVAYAYSSYRIFGIFSMAATIGAKSFFDGIGKTKVHFWASLIMNVFNVLLCWMFIFGHLGAPRMGASGAGLGALIATWVGLSVVFFYVWRDRNLYGFFNIKNLSWSLLWQMVQLSAPAAVATIVMMAGFGKFVGFAQELDGIAGGGRNGATTTNMVEIMKLIFVACIGFGAAGATLVGQSIGAGRNDLAKRYGWSAARTGAAIFAVVGLLVGVVFNAQICAFVTHDVGVQALMHAPLRAMGLATPLIAIALILTEALFGAGRAASVALVQLTLVFGVLVPTAKYLSKQTDMGVYGMWVAAVVYAVLASAALSVLFARVKPKAL